MAQDKNHIQWLQAQIALQQDSLSGLTGEARRYKQGHIDLLELRLKAVRNELRGEKQKK